jgi:hypothetical protein
MVGFSTTAWGNDSEVTHLPSARPVQGRTRISVRQSSSRGEFILKSSRGEFCRVREGRGCGRVRNQYRGASQFPPRYYLWEATMAAAGFENGDARTATCGLLPGVIRTTTRDSGGESFHAWDNDQDCSYWARRGERCKKDFGLVKIWPNLLLWVFFVFSAI